MISVPMISQVLRDKSRFDRKLCAAKISMRSATENTRVCGTKNLLSDSKKLLSYGTDV